VADGRLHLSAVVLLAPHLEQGSADGLIEAATHKSKSEIERLLAERFPKPELRAFVRALPAARGPETEHAPGRVGTELELTAAPVAAGSEHAPGRVRPRVTPLAPQRFGLQVTIGQGTHDKLRHAQSLLGNSRVSGDLEQVLDRALDALIERLERRKFAVTGRPRSRRSAGEGRALPAEVRRTVWQRDGGRCTFTSDTGHRCEARRFLEFDHIEPVARGGRTTVANVRLRCRAHNQYAAECAFGSEFMHRKRELTRERRLEARETAEAEHARAESAERARAAAERVRAEAEARVAGERARAEVLPWLRQLGVRADEARSATELSDADPKAPLAERVRLALRHLAPRGTHRTGSVVPGTA
jgi:hypothetical protein